MVNIVTGARSQGDTDRVRGHRRHRSFLGSTVERRRRVRPPANIVHGTDATIMGLAFASSVGTLAWFRWRDDRADVDRVAVAVAVVSLIAPPLLGVLTEVSRTIQRAMLLTWAAWYLTEVRSTSVET
jgi:hypothetical protein